MDASLLFVTDGLSGMKDAISRVFPDSRHQSCWVHLARNVSQSVRVKDRHDEGITGTNTKRRVEFNKMILDALAGQINLSITKSISRFARNTLDTISYLRKLKDKGIEVYFKKENLWTLDPKSELILTIMASIAQEESRSISQNVT
ncbi:Transposase and inactivated derivatives [Acholeplasma oculi]|uniref:Resolvase n=1 Tax=Acholeplasma oculi TaxID=35623 RepID=A0A061AH08_9MOLU|nr:Resolvase [Acholeplasma oculi]SKC43878.1 MULE transposase domain-containing protein [Acholeplasma oculi]SUT88589.1 Transposase and inactivated derivatives [Acholeplasma oculi]